MEDLSSRQKVHPDDFNVVIMSFAMRTAGRNGPDHYETVQGVRHQRAKDDARGGDSRRAWVVVSTRGINMVIVNDTTPGYSSSVQC